MAGKRKWMAGIAALAAVLGIAARIWYVNARYPYTHMTSHAMEDGVVANDIRIRVDGFSLYTRQAWSDYLAREALDGAVTIVEEDMREILLELTFTNLARERRSFNLTSIQCCVDYYNNGQDRSFGKAANGLDGNELALAPGEERSIRLAYCLSTAFVPQARLEALEGKSGYVYFMNFYDSHRIKAEEIQFIR